MMDILEKLEIMHGDMTQDRDPTVLNWPATITEAKQEIEKLRARLSAMVSEK